MRRRDWLPRLLEYVESVRASPYHPVTHNCALFVAGAIRAMRDDDPVKQLGVELRSVGDIDATLERYGGVRGVCDTYLGPARAPLLASRGDVVVKKGLGGDTLGLCMGPHALFLSEDGLQARDLAECENCWRVE